MSAKDAPVQVHDCWNRIGVWSRTKPSCPLLEQVVHCHNCETYHAASRVVFERKPPEGYQREWTHLLAQAKADQSVAANSVLVFRLQNEWVALPTACFQDVEAWREMRRVPHVRGQVLQGVVNINGRVEPCFSLAAVLGIDMPAVQAADQSGIYARFLVMVVEDRRYVFPVSEVGGLHRYHAAQLESIPVTAAQSIASHAQGIFLWGEREVACLNLEQVVASFERGFG